MGVVLGECRETRLGVHCVRPGGELRVLPSSGRMDDDPGAWGVFDVFDAAGRLVRPVEARVPCDRALCHAVMP